MKRTIKLTTFLILAIMTKQGIAQCSGPIFSVISPQSFTLGCNSKSLCTISIINAATSPTPGGAVSYSLIAPGNPTVLPSGSLSLNNVYTVSTSGIWSIVVRDNTTSCDTWSTITITSNTALPVIGTVSASQNPLNCSTPSTTLQATTNPGMSYVWYFNNIPGSLQSNSISVVTVTAAPTMTLIDSYTLVVTDYNNTCQSFSVIPIYQNLFPPTASISAGGGSLNCSTSTLVLTNQSTTGIPVGPFPTNQPVVGLLWEGPAPQVNSALSSTYLAQTAGVYTMTAKDMNNGCIQSTTYTVTNAMLGPVAAFTHTVTSGVAAFTDVSTGTSTFSVSYFWDFGDGNTSTLQNPTHIYANGGSHIVKFKITTPFCSDSVIQSVNVSGIPCTANSNFSTVPTATAHVWNVVPVYPWNITAAKWNWGDGHVTDSLYTSHYYATTGMYNICLSVTVSCGDTSTTCTTYSVYRASEEAKWALVYVIAPQLVSGLSNIKNDGQPFWDIIPNPNAGNFKLKSNTPVTEPVRFIITDLSGRILREQMLEPDESIISAGDLNSGIYFVTLETGTIKVTKRMVVLH